MERIYFDNASTTFPKPPAVAEAVYRYLTEGGCNINRGSYQKAYETEEQVYETRQALSDLFGGPGCQDVIFTLECDGEPQCAVKGFLHPGDHVLVSSMEHNAVMRPLRQLEAHGVPVYPGALPPGRNVGSGGPWRPVWRNDPGRW